VSERGSTYYNEKNATEDETEDEPDQNVDAAITLFPTLETITAIMCISHQAPPCG